MQKLDCSEIFPGLEAVMDKTTGAHSRHWEQASSRERETSASSPGPTFHPMLGLNLGLHVCRAGAALPLSYYHPCPECPNWSDTLKSMTQDPFRTPQGHTHPRLLFPDSTMPFLWLCWALWALSLVSLREALTGEQILGSLLQQLQLDQPPVLDKADVEGMVIPSHVRTQYVALLQHSHASRSRGKRFSQNLREVAGRFLVSETSTHLLVFGMEQRLPPNSELVQAVLRLFQEPVPRTALRRQKRLSPHSARARVTIEWLRFRDDGSNRTALIDSRLVSIHESGWKAFDVTEAVNFWQQLSRPRQPLLLQVSVQREHLGPGTWSSHKLVRFAAQGTPDGKGQGEPQLELHTLDLKDYGAQGNCDPEAPVTEGTRCCRQEMYLDLQGMKWAENWILEPPGFLTYECVGSCLQLPESLTSRWPFLGPRQCVASEMTSLPMIVSVKEGGRTRPQVVSLPNMRVQTCSCASDGALIPRRLQP